MTDEMTPKWAVELLVRFEQLDSKITAAEERNNSHASWAERNIKDLETRMRAQERNNDPRISERVGKLETFRFIMTGAVLASGFLGAGLQKLIGG